MDEAIEFLVAERKAGGPVCNATGQLQAMRNYYAQPDRFNGLSCKAGHSDISFDPQGNVRLCYFLEPVATVFDLSPFALVWDSPKTCVVALK